MLTPLRARMRGANLSTVPTLPVANRQSSTYQDESPDWREGREGGEGLQLDLSHVRVTRARTFPTLPVPPAGGMCWRIRSLILHSEVSFARGRQNDDS